MPRAPHAELFVGVALLRSHLTAVVVREILLFFSFFFFCLLCFSWTVYRRFSSFRSLGEHLGSTVGGGGGLPGCPHMTDDMLMASDEQVGGIAVGAGSSRPQLAAGT